MSLRLAVLGSSGLHLQVRFPDPIHPIPGMGRPLELDHLPRTSKHRLGSKVDAQAWPMSAGDRVATSCDGRAGPGDVSGFAGVVKVTGRARVIRQDCRVEDAGGRMVDLLCDDRPAPCVVHPRGAA